MRPVKFEQNKKAEFLSPRKRYTVDACLPQRQAVDSGKVGFHALSHGHYPGTKITPEFLPGVPSLGYFDVIGEQDWGIPSHRNEGIEICFQQTGESVLTVDGAIHRMTPNTLSLTRPWQLHSLGNPHLKPGRLFWVILDVGVRRPNQSWRLPPWSVLTQADQEELVKKLRGNEHPLWQATSELGISFSRMASLVEGDCPQRHISQIRILLNSLLLGLLNVLREQNVKADETLTTRRRVVQIFLEELKGDPELLAYAWTLDRMAEHCGMKRTTFSDYCRELINTSPLMALNRWRLAHAAGRLKSETKTAITTIAMEVGYSSSQYFASKFKQEYGVSPRQWRNDSM